MQTSSVRKKNITREALRWLQWLQCLSLTALSACGGVYYSDDYRAPTPAFKDVPLEEQLVVRIEVNECAAAAMLTNTNPNVCERDIAAELRANTTILAYGKGSFEEILFGDGIFDGTVQVSTTATGRTSWEGLILVWPTIATLGTIPAPGAIDSVTYNMRIGENETEPLTFRERKWMGWIPAAATNHEKYYERKWKLLANQIMSRVEKKKADRPKGFVSYLKTTQMMDEVLSESRFDDVQPPTRCALPKMHYIFQTTPEGEKLNTLLVAKALSDCYFFSDLEKEYAPTLGERLIGLLDAMARLEKRWQRPLFHKKTVEDMKSQTAASLLSGASALGADDVSRNPPQDAQTTNENNTDTAGMAQISDTNDTDTVDTADDTDDVVDTDSTPDSEQTESL
ncbi:MAG: hypothetical protein JXX29_16095 [Deltaproteobacteria bacterium]|nr:hypothetical protein [Deltaproteobacteria bacterium]